MRVPRNHSHPVRIDRGPLWRSLWTRVKYLPKSLGTAFAALLQKGVGALVVASLASTPRMVRPSFVAAENRSARHDLAHHRM